MIVRKIHNISEIGVVDQIIDLSFEKYLDKLVVEATDLEILKKQPKELRSKVFLEELGLGPMEDYIQNTIRERFPVSLIPDGDLYVLTPKHGFRYIKTRGSILSSPTAMNEFGSEGTLEDAVNHLSRLILEDKEAGKQTLIQVLFYNEDAKILANSMLKKIRLQVSSTKDLYANNRYGPVKLYTYITK